MNFSESQSPSIQVGDQVQLSTGSITVLVGDIDPVHNTASCYYQDFNGYPQRIEIHLTVLAHYIPRPVEQAFDII